MCQDRKMCYASKEEAMEAINGKLKKWGKPVEPYKCCYCKHWHVRTIQKKCKIKRELIKRAIRKYIKIINGDAFTS